MYFSKSHFQPKGKCAIITGASQGLGAELARQLYLRGCTVIIVARTEQKLKTVVEDIKKETVKEGSPDALYIAADVSKYEKCVQVWEKVKELNYDPDFVFCCAGSTVCKLFEDLSGQELEQGIEVNYMTALYFVHAGFKQVVSLEVRKKRHVVFFSSVVSFFTFAGYSQYAPLKSALESLSLSLRQEMGPYGYRVSCIFPGNFASEGYEEEQRTKPQITKDIEGPSKPISTTQCTNLVIDKLSKGYDTITTDFIGWFLGCSVLGMLPREWGFFQTIMSLILLIIAPIVNWVIYRDVEKFYKQRNEAKKTK